MVLRENLSHLNRDKDLINVLVSCDLRQHFRPVATLSEAHSRAAVVTEVFPRRWRPQSIVQEPRPPAASARVLRGRRGVPSQDEVSRLGVRLGVRLGSTRRRCESEGKQAERGNA